MKQDKMGERIKEIRKDNKLSQQEFADKIYVSQQTVTGYEKGQFQPDISVLIRMATVFHVSLEYIVGMVDFKNPPYEIPELDYLEISVLDCLKSFSSVAKEQLKNFLEEIQRSKKSDERA